MGTIFGLNENPLLLLIQFVHLQCHIPIPGSTRLADLNRVRGARLRTGTLYLIFFFKKKPTSTCGYGPHPITESKYYIHITESYLQIQNFTFTLQIRARNLHVVNPYKCVGPAVCGCLLTSSSVPTRIKNPC